MEHRTPTHRKIGVALQHVVDEITREMEESGGMVFNFQQLRSVAATFPLLVDDDRREIIESGLAAGIDSLEFIAARHPESAEDVAVAAQAMLLAMFGVINEVATKAIEGEMVRIAPLVKQNDAKAQLIARACDIAETLWREDSDQSIRISGMADQVYRALSAEGFTDTLPGSADPIKIWIKPVAPDYARKGGRPAKP
jgi:hypothetical protein